MTSAECLVSRPAAGRYTERLRLVCQYIKKETDDVKTYFFKVDHPEGVSFKPGQFITLELPIEGETVYRSYTISSSALQKDSLAITVKQVPDGKASNWLAQYFKEGDWLWATEPAGQFNLMDIPADSCLFLSAGSGITPMMAMSRWLVDSANKADICFIHSARSEQDIIFREELQQLSNQVENFTLHFILEVPADITPWHGRINSEILQQIVPDLHDRTLFVCGPEPYMNSIKSIIDDMGFDRSRFYQENYRLPEPVEQAQSAALSTAPISSETMTIELANSRKCIEVYPGELILDALEKNGSAPPSACRAGVCGACRIQAIEGRVNSSSQLTLTEKDIESGYFLACCARADSDLVLVL